MGLVPSGEAKTYSWESGMGCVGLHSAQTFQKYLSLPTGNQSFSNISLTSTDLSVVYFSWKGYEELERNLKKKLYAKVIPQSFFRLDQTRLESFSWK